MAAQPVAAAPGDTAPAVPTDIEIVRSQGFLIYGAFGNPGTPCTNGNAIWVASTHPQYDKMYATALAALTTGRKLIAYVSVCTSNGWHGGTYNETTGSDAMYIRR